MSVRTATKAFLLKVCPPLHHTIELFVWNVRWQRSWNLFQKEHAHEPEMLALIKSVYKQTTMLLMPDEAYFLHQCSKQLRDVPGDYAEVGAFRGGSSRIICEAKGEKKLYVFDTFEGLPDVREEEASILGKGQYTAQYEKVANLLSPFPNVHLIKGIFPESAGPVSGNTFALAHLDVDLYESMKAGLEFFWERLSKGGMIVVHDIQFEGVQKAVDEFKKLHSDAQVSPGKETQVVVRK
jgi:hypothetical protein